MHTECVRCYGHLGSIHLWQLIRKDKNVGLLSYPTCEPQILNSRPPFVDDGRPNFK